MLVKSTKRLMSQQQAICFTNWGNRFVTHTLSHVGNGGKVTYVTKGLKDSINYRTLTLQRGSKGFKEENSQAGSSFHWAFTVHCLNDSNSMPKLMNWVISAQIKNDHVFLRRVSESGGDFPQFHTRTLPLDWQFSFPLIYYHSKAESCSVHRSWFSFPLVLSCSKHFQFILLLPFPSPRIM